MNLKYLVNYNGVILALKFDPIEHTVAIGGNGRFMLQMEELILNYFKPEEKKMKWVQKNKVRFDFGYTGGIIDVLSQMTEHGIVMESKKNLGRIMS